MQIEKINPKFRLLTDLLFFTDRKDIDLAEYKSLLNNNTDHRAYFWDRFYKASSISWDAQFWNHRLDFILSLNDSKLSKLTAEYLEKRIFNLLKTKDKINFSYDIEYLQYVELCKIKKSKGLSLKSAREYLVLLPSYTTVKNAIEIINSFIPIVYDDANDFINALIKNATQLANQYNLLLEFQKSGVKFDKKPIANLLSNILLKNCQNDKDKRIFFSLIDDQEIIDLIKKDYDDRHKSGLKKVIKNTSLSEFRHLNFKIFKNVLRFDPSLLSDLTSSYLNSVYSRGFNHKMANIDATVKLIKEVPEVTPKKVLSFLSSKKMPLDSRLLIEKFPELNKLAAFI